MNVKRLLVLTDFDDLSKKVLSFAKKLAEQLKVSEIVSLNIIPALYTHPKAGDILASGSLMADQLNNVMLEKHQELAEKEARRFSTDKIMVIPKVTFGHSVTGVNTIMDEWGAGLLISGSRDENSFWEKLFGSDTEKIIRKIDYPAIILKKETEVSEIKNIAVAIDVNEENQEGLKEIFDFGSDFDAHLQLLHVISDNKISSEEAIEKLHNLAKKYELKNYEINIVNNDSLERGLHSFIRKNNPDMIAVLSQGKSKIKKLIFGSNIEDIIEEADKPVFISRVS